LETRHIWTSTALNNYVNFPHCAQVFCLQRNVSELVTGKQRSETIYGITSLSARCADPVRLLELVRGHWSIENKLHWVRDVTFDEDRCQIRTGYAPQVMACLRNLAISILRIAGARFIPSALRACARVSSLTLRLIGLADQL
jgi:hypothetical protein